MNDATVSFATGPMWAGFIVFVLAMLALDLFVLGGRKAHRVHVREAAAWVAVWVSLALGFAGLLWWYLNDTQGAEVARTKTLEFLAGYLIEQSLSVDNMFVFVMIFTYFAVPPELQRRVLLYGVLGAIVMRAGMILGEERIVTNRSGRYGWPDGSPGEVFVFDGDGRRVAKPLVAEAADGTAWRVEIRLPSDHFAVIVKRP